MHPLILPAVGVIILILVGIINMHEMKDCMRSGVDHDTCELAIYPEHDTMDHM